MNQIIFTCGCGQTDEFSKDAFKILFRDAKLPPIVHIPPNTNNELVSQMVYGINKSKHKFSYFIKYDDEAAEVWDLLKGVRIV